MLDRSKVISAINQVSDKLFLDLSSELTLARTLWEQIINDQSFASKAHAANGQLLIPSWTEHLDAIHPVESQCGGYSIASVDGSQIYPDRHQGTSCFLINIGSVVLHYGLNAHGAKLSSVPFVYPELDDNNFDLTTDLVNCRRQELEFNLGLTLCKDVLQESGQLPSLFLFDGSLIFWHLQAKEVEVKDYFLCRYLHAMDQFYKNRIVMAGYISAPKSKELVNLLRLQLCNFDVSACEDFHALDHIVDASVARFFLQPLQRSGLFANKSPITQNYPPHLKPYFFYVDLGVEIGRVEIPAWIAQEKQLVDRVAQLLYDQIQKGYGYPIAIAEAHEQAVVKGPDRDFFYHVIQKLSMDHHKRFSISQKSQKKRRIGV